MADREMAIYSGLIVRLEASDDEVAQVMGHEISRALSAHTTEEVLNLYQRWPGTRDPVIELGGSDQPQELQRCRDLIRPQPAPSPA